MNKEELVEWVAKTDYEFGSPKAYFIWGELSDKDKAWYLRKAKRILSHPDLYLRVKCPHCVWWKIKAGESVYMTPCPYCNSTGYIYEALEESSE